jgi:hypothetical protein
LARLDRLVLGAAGPKGLMNNMMCATRFDAVTAVTLLLISFAPAPLARSSETPGLVGTVTDLSAAAIPNI